MIPILVHLFVAALGGAPDTDAELRALLATITPGECGEHVSFLAGPGCYGRATPSAGLDRAAAYVERRLAEIGLEPAGAEGSYRIPYPLPGLVAGPEARMILTRPGKEPLSLAAGADFVPVPGSRSAAAEGAPLFVGYAIEARSERWADLPDARVRRKIIFAFTREPHADDPRNRSFEGLEASRHSRIARKVRAVAAAGGAALVLVPDPAGFPELEGPLPGTLPAYLPPGVEPARYEAGAGWPEIPVVHASRAVAESIFGEDLAAYQKAIDKRHKPRHLAAPRKTRLRLVVDWDRAEIHAYNLAARIPGTGTEAGVVVLGAHLDHIGVNGSAQVNPGADDNASGSAALLEVAEALATTRPQADILFLWFTGEELGLLGSQAYCRQPLYPHEETLVMLNMDMVGRGDPSKVNVGGVWDRPGWAALLRAQMKRLPDPLRLDLEEGRELYNRSDQFSFAEQDVPALFFTEGDFETNHDYHTPKDLPGGVEDGKVAAVARFLAATAYAVAGEGARP